MILDGRDIGTKSVSIKFVAGEAVWVSMEVAPWIAPVKVVDDEESDSPYVVEKQQ